MGGKQLSDVILTLFINNLISYIKFSNVILFADDVQIHIECDTLAIDNGIKIINEELENIIQYGEVDYGIETNPSTRPRQLYYRQGIIYTD